MENTQTVNKLMDKLRDIEFETIQQVEFAFIDALQDSNRNIEIARDYVQQLTISWLYKMSDNMATQYNFRIMMAKYDDKTSND